MSFFSLQKNNTKKTNTNSVKISLPHKRLIECKAAPFSFPEHGYNSPAEWMEVLTICNVGWCHEISIIIIIKDQFSNISNILLVLTGKIEILLHKLVSLFLLELMADFNLGRLMYKCSKIKGWNSSLNNYPITPLWAPHMFFCNLPQRLVS